MDPSAYLCHLLPGKISVLKPETAINIVHLIQLLIMSVMVDPCELTGTYPSL